MSHYLLLDCKGIADGTLNQGGKLKAWIIVIRATVGRANHTFGSGRGGHDSGSLVGIIAALRVNRLEPASYLNPTAGSYTTWGKAYAST